MERLRALDLVRGWSIIGIIFIHSAVYCFGGLDQVDFAHPPLIIAVIAILANWGGLFLVVSAVANTRMAYLRIRADDNQHAVRHTLVNWALSGAVLLALHYLYNIVLGPTSFDFVTHHHHLALIPATIRSGHLTLPDAKRYFEGSTFSMLAWGLMLTAGLLFLLLRRGGIVKSRRNGIILATAGTILILAGWARPFLFPLCAQAVAEKRYLLATILSFTIDKPYPLLPYLGFAFFGAMIGLLIAAAEPLGKVMRRMGVIGSIWLALGVSGIIVLPQSIAKADTFWFAKVLMEIGIFTIVVTACLWWNGTGRRSHPLPGPERLSLVRSMGMVSCSVYLLQTPLSETLARLWTYLFPGWNMAIGTTLLFAAFNVLIWLGIMVIWRRYRFVGSWERFWAWLFRKIGRESCRGQVFGQA